MNSKHTKRALLGSFTSLLLCFAMLIGSTFAWFTDTASTSVNTIQAGTLNVALEMWDTTANNGQGDWVPAEGKTLSFVKATGAAQDEAVLWEPGATYSLPKIRIINNGSLALKFKANVLGATGDLMLANVLDVTAKYGEDLDNANSTVTFSGKTLAEVLAAVSDPDGLAHGQLGANESVEIAISMKMQTTAGNEYQGKSISGIAITVLATQDTVEYDSENNTYDAQAEYPTIVASTEELATALNSAQPGEVVALTPGSTYTLPARIADGVEINGNGATVSVPVGEGSYDRLYSGATFTNVVFGESNGQNGLYINGEATFVGCTFNCKIWNAQPVSGTVSFEDCIFNQPVHFAPDSAGASVTGKFFEAKGCTFEKDLRVQGFEMVTLTNCEIKGTNWSNMNMISYCPVTFNNCTLNAGLRLAETDISKVVCVGCSVAVSRSGQTNVTITG